MTFAFNNYTLTLKFISPIRFLSFCDPILFLSCLNFRLMAKSYPISTFMCLIDVPHLCSADVLACTSIVFSVASPCFPVLFIGVLVEHNAANCCIVTRPRAHSIHSITSHNNRLYIQPELLFYSFIVHRPLVKIIYNPFQNTKYNYRMIS